MHALIRASARLLAMGVALAAAVALSAIVGLGTTAGLAIGIVAAGLIGILTASRRPRKPSAHDEIAAMMAPAPSTVTTPVSLAQQATAVEAMAPVEIREVDPEANMPRWRRPSLLEARRADPTRQAPAHRTPMRFADGEVQDDEVRTVRYAVVPLLDRPDEIHGARIAHLESGDEVRVISSQGTFLEVHCPDGERGFVHRTTLRPREVALAGAAGSESHEDVLAALLAARGLPQQS